MRISEVKDMEERRQVSRTPYNAPSVIIDCTTQEKYDVQVEDVSPLGMGIRVKNEIPNLIGRDIIISAETLIMFAEVMRQEKQADNSYRIGISAKRFSGDVLDFLFNKIESDSFF